MSKRLFLSYSSKDLPFADRLATDLSNLGMDLWFDRFQVAVGDSIPGKIAEGLATCDSFLIILSPESVRSNWVFTELNTAIQEKCAGKLDSIYPLLLQKCRIPSLLRHIRYADFTQHYDLGFKELAISLGLQRVSSDRERLLISLIEGLIEEWSSSDSRLAARAEWQFTHLCRNNQVFKQRFADAVCEHLSELEAGPFDNDTADLLRVISRVIVACDFSGYQFAFLLTRTLSKLATVSGANLNTFENVVDALVVCWDDKCKKELNSFYRQFPERRKFVKQIFKNAKAEQWKVRGPTPNKGGAADG